MESAWNNIMARYIAFGLSSIFSLILARFALGATPPIEPSMQGINLGGWLILEQFITPSIFNNANDSRINSESAYVQYLRNDTSKIDVLRNHWNTWVQEEDIRKLAEIGFTHVRLPIGYWAMLSQEELDMRGEYYITGQWPYVVRCLQWLKKYGIQAIIDLHGAPKSQNGWDNSGEFIPFEENVGWGEGDTVNRTIDIMDTLSIWIADLENNSTTNGSVAGIELMNEAFPWRINGGLATIQDYYIRAYNVVRRHLPAEKYWVMIEEAFSPFSWTNFMQSPEFEKVVLDLHIYQCFDDSRYFSYEKHLNQTCQILVDQVTEQTLPTVVGEWSVAFKVESAIADKEPYPNVEDINFMSQYALAQMKTYQSHFFWNFKTESAPMWDYFLGVNGTWLPSRLPSPDLSQACGDSAKRKIQVL